MTHPPTPDCRPAGPDSWRRGPWGYTRVPRSPIPVVHVRLHPSLSRVTVIDAARNRATMSYDSYAATCWLAADVIFDRADEPVAPSRPTPGVALVGSRA